MPTKEELELTRVINASWSPLRTWLSTGNAERLIWSQQEGALLQAMPWDEWLHNLAPVQPTMESAITKGIRGVKVPNVTASLSFNVIDDISVKYGAQQSGKLIKNLSDTSRATVRQVISDSMRGNYTVQSATSALRSTVGLQPGWGRAVMNHGNRIMETALKNGATESAAIEAKIKGMEKYAAKLNRARAANIARTEIQTASNVGAWASWEHAIKEGYAEPDSIKEWEPGPGACKRCAPMSGERVQWNEPFSFGGMMPPAHPSCRCSASLLPPDFNAKPKDWTGTGVTAPKRPPRTPAKLDEARLNEDMFRSQLEPGSFVYSIDPVTKAPGRVEIINASDVPGALGKPFSVESSYHVLGANRKTGATLYENNCTSCATAYEFRRRGFNVTAGHNNGKGRNNKEWMSGWWNNKNGTPRSVTQQPAELVEDWWDEMPIGSRGVMSVAWKAGGAHAINWEKMKDGTVWILDGQIGKRSRFADYRKRITGPVTLMRTDDAIPNRNILKAMENNPMDPDEWNKVVPQTPKMTDEDLRDVMDFLNE